MTPPPWVRIHYLRPPDRREIFRQRLVLDDPAVKVTLAGDLDFDPPLRIHGRVALETGSSAVWFTFPDAWHDIGLFHRADGRPTGTYANILTPPVVAPDHEWHTTDLFLDVWVTPGGELSVLDGDQFAEARRLGWIDEATARRAEEEVAAIRAAFEEGRWPPPVVRSWTLERAARSVGA